MPANIGIRSAIPSSLLISRFDALGIGLGPSPASFDSFSRVTTQSLQLVLRLVRVVLRDHITEEIVVGFSPAFLGFD